ncbi:MAG: 50S ribosomal protein L1 [Victivallaceae bacterium]|nr:50S ribosomal protein L1 [Victivallaceae bacterium]
MKMSKLYKAQTATVDAEKKYGLLEGLSLLKAMPHAKFDETVEVSIRLGVDTRKSDQTVRGAVALPRGTGKNVRVAVVVSDEGKAAEAKAAGADLVGFEDIVEKIKGGWTDFDILIATPDAMKLVRPLGRQLGPRGLMPNPKTGTVTDAVANAVAEAKAGRAEFRADRGSCVHVPIGKISFEAEALAENFNAVAGALDKAKPATAKGTYILSCTLSSTMSPGVKIDLKEVARQKNEK